MKLYGFFRSGTSHRLRIALNLKGIRYQQIAIDLRHDENLGFSRTLPDRAAVAPEALKS